MGRAELRGISVAYDDLSARGGTTSERVLLLIHGHPFDRSMWRPQAEVVAAAGWRVIVPDLRGYGETSVVPGKTTLEAFANDLAGLLDALGIRHVVVGGLSMGGQIAMEFARLHADRLDGLLLAATFPRIDTDEGRRHRIEVADRLEREGMAAYADELLPRMLSGASITALPHVAEHVRSMMQQAPPMGSAAALRGRAERSPYESVLARLEIPALIVVGDEDPFTTRDDAEQMHQLLSQSRLVWLPGVGHLPNLERPAEFNAALIAFLDAAKPSPPVPNSPKATMCLPHLQCEAQRGVSNARRHNEQTGSVAPVDDHHRRVPFPSSRTPKTVRAGSVRPSSPVPAPNPPEPSRKPLRVGGAVSAPVVVSRVEPTYAACKGKQVWGFPILEAVIDEAGHVRDLRLLKPVHPCLEAAILPAVRQWRFKPGTAGGKPVSVIYNLTVAIHYQ